MLKPILTETYITWDVIGKKDVLQVADGSCRPDRGIIEPWM